VLGRGSDTAIILKCELAARRADRVIRQARPRPGTGQTRQLRNPGQHHTKIIANNLSCTRRILVRRELSAARARIR
jgi:hypothetical protein